MTTWTFNGRYGDSPSEVVVKTEPALLPQKLQAALRDLVNEAELHDDMARELRDLGLVREYGNAWNPGLIFAPVVYEWLKLEDQSATINAAVEAQYNE